MTKTKICPRCDAEKPLADFTKKRGTFGWLCKKCSSRYIMERREANRKTHDDWLKGIYDWKKKNPDKMKKQRQRAWKRGKLARVPKPPRLCIKCSGPTRYDICYQCKYQQKRLLKLEANRAKKADKLRRIAEKKQLSIERKMSKWGIKITDDGIIRLCSVCRQWKPIEDFRHRTGSKCYPCYREHKNARRREYFKNHPHKRREKERKQENRKRNMVGSHTEEEWQAILRANGHKCVFCGSGDDLTRDHIIPSSLGGTDYPENIQPLCRKCNSSKGKRILYRVKI